MKKFIKIRKWAEEVGATVVDSNYFDKITVTLPKGQKFELQQKESTSSRVISRGRGTKWAGSPKGLYMREGNGYSFQEQSQIVCIEKMSRHL